jgi:Ni,Fe-hydrogenase III small subunit
MSQWVINGILRGIKTTIYPAGAENASGVTPGLPGGGEFDAAAAKALIDCCPSQVFSSEGGKVTADVRRCIHCYRCVRVVERSANWKQTYEWAIIRSGLNEFLSAFRKSIHICVVDAGDCGACLNEVRQLNNPYYNMHRLGFFITPTPRHADILLVVGPVTDHMCFALEKIYDAMPPPKRVMAIGTCALTGGVFAESLVSAKGVADVLPVDVEVPGDPPPPLSILHGLLLAAGRKSPGIISTPPETKAVK